MRGSETFFGTVQSVSGSEVRIGLAEVASSGLAIIKGVTYRIGQVGSFVRIPQGYKELFGIICEVGAENGKDDDDTGRWVSIQLVGEIIGSSFERGISQYPNVGDKVHLVTEQDLRLIYGGVREGHVQVGRLASSENIAASIDLDKLVTRHSAVLGSTGSGKSTTVASLLRSIATGNAEKSGYPSARILLLDIHGEYASAFSDIATIFRIDPNRSEQRLLIPYWALEIDEIINFLFGSVSDPQLIAITDKIISLKIESANSNQFEGVPLEAITIDMPIPFSLKRLWYELIDVELMTFSDTEKQTPAIVKAGDPSQLREPVYSPATTTNSAPFMNKAAPGLLRSLRAVRSKLLDKQYDFLLNPGSLEPNLEGKVEADLPQLLGDWLGQDKPITILDLSGIPSVVLIRLVGSILRVIYSALFWGRGKSEGGRHRPLLVVMEEAHRYLADSKSVAAGMVQQIVKEGRKYGIGAMVVSQRPSEVDETILSQCGTFIGLRLTNPTDRGMVKGTVPDGLSGLMEMLPVLRTGEALIVGESATLPIRCRVTLPEERHRPNSGDPKVAEAWAMTPSTLPNYKASVYNAIVASWRSQQPYRESDAIVGHIKDKGHHEERAMNRTPVSSSNIRSIGYDANTETLEVEFNDGSIYHYSNVSGSVHQALMEASSHGSYLAQNIKGQYPYTRIN